ncbi:NAD-dependent histone deacetylase sir2, partial [Sticta canariensis]|nr:NAD-dependent histone deacetylase sir2 [Sticta canariensis]
MNGTGNLHESPLKAPAVEIIDLQSAIESGEDLSPCGNGCDAWETGEESDEDDEDEDGLSIYEEALNAMDDEELAEGGDSRPDACTPEESHAYRRRLRLIGEGQFIKETVEAQTITAKKLCTAFGVRLPSFLDDAPDTSYYPLLGLCISRELSKRQKLLQYNTIDDAVSLLKGSKNIIVLTGAGISTSLGIPDFRSKETGLYSQLQHLGLSDPQEVFDISTFREDPSIFYSVAKDILPSTKKFTPTHAFIRLLQEKGKLLTNFTQNIDNLEGHAGILPEKLIQCHGSFATASCVECNYKVRGEEIYRDLKAGRVPRCDRCIRNLREAKPAGIKRKRSSGGLPKGKKIRKEYEDSTDEENYEIAVAGVMKPDITFFGEDLPKTFHDRLVEHDRSLVDLVLIIGTSLKVAPVSEIPSFLPPGIPQLYISREHCSHVDFDVNLLGDCDIVVTELCRRAGWDLQHEMIPQAQKIDVQLRDVQTCR